MMIRARRPFLRGLVMLLSFAAVFVVLLQPVLKEEDGRRTSGLEYADDVFNSLSKGSSYFIPEVQAAARRLQGFEESITVPVRDESLAALAVEVLRKAGAEEVSLGERRRGQTPVHLRGDMGRLLLSASRDADNLFHNEGKFVTERYGGLDALDVARAWWHFLSPAVQELQKAGKVAQAGIVETVVRKAIEPGNNFYGIRPASVGAHFVLMAAMLVFYILYTLWYGFAIFALCEGFGLDMTGKPEK